MINLSARACIMFYMVMSNVPILIIATYALTELIMMAVNGMRVVVAEAKTMEVVMTSDSPYDMPKKYKSLYFALVKQGKV
jgi:hypothetical protein